MNLRAPLACGTVLSLAAVCVWSWTANLSIGAPASPHLTRNLLADYAQLAGAATGNGIALYAAVAAIYTACFFASGLHARSRALRDARRESQHHTEDMETAPAPGRWS